MISARIEISTLAALSYCAAVGALFFNIQPVLIGAIAGSFAFDEQQLGSLVSVGLFTGFFVLASSFFWVTLVDWRRSVGCGIVVSLAAMIMLFAAANYAGVAASCGVLGLGMALIYAPALVALGSTPDPTRSFGLAITAMVLLAGVCVLLIPTFFMPRWGLQGVAAFLAILFALTVVTLPWLPRGKDTLAVAVSGKVTRPGLAGFGLLAMAIYFVGVNSNWAFFELIGTSIGFDKEAIGYTLALSLVFGAFGSLAASVTSQRIQTTTALTIGILGMGVYVVLMRSDPGALGFTAALLIFNVAWNYSLPFQMDMVAEADASGRFVALLPASQTAGGAIGPILAGPLLMSVGVDALYAVLAAGCVVAGLIFALVRRRL